MHRLALLAPLAACTTLGPTPLTTGLSAQPAGRFDVAVQAGAVGGYYLSGSAQEFPDAPPQPQLAAVVEPGDSAPGLVVGLRALGGDGDSQLEPVVGYRAHLDADLAIAVFGTGAVASGEGGYASYDMVRLAGEVVAERTLGRTPWAALHVTGALDVVATRATGFYCSDERGYAIECSGTPSDLVVDADVDLVAPAASAGLALDLGAGRRHWLHGARLATHLTATLLPTVQAYSQVGRSGELSGGVTLTVAFGEP